MVQNMDVIVNFMEDVNIYVENVYGIWIKKWWKYMADIMETNQDNSPVTIALEQVFYLE